MGVSGPRQSNPALFQGSLYLNASCVSSTRPVLRADEKRHRVWPPSEKGGGWHSHPFWPLGPRSYVTIIITLLTAIQKIHTGEDMRKEALKVRGCWKRPPGMLLLWETWRTSRYLQGRQGGGPGSRRDYGASRAKGVQSLKHNLKGEQVEKRNRLEPCVLPKVFIHTCSTRLQYWRTQTILEEWWWTEWIPREKLPEANSKNILNISPLALEWGSCLSEYQIKSQFFAPKVTI